MEDRGNNLKEFIDDVNYVMFDNTAADGLGQMETPLIDGEDAKEGRPKGISPVSITSPTFQRTTEHISVPRMQEIDVTHSGEGQVEAGILLDKDGNIAGSELTHVTQQSAEEPLVHVDEPLTVPADSILSNEQALALIPEPSSESQSCSIDPKEHNVLPLSVQPERTDQYSNTSPEVPTFTRVDSSLMGVVENPLQKSGRHTVITGRLPDANPFYIAVQSLGIKLVSKKYGGYIHSTNEATRRENFDKDLYAFLSEMRSKGLKIPIIGGGNLDLYALAREVMLLGGVQNVVKKRAFRIVGQQLELPKSCTSAAFVLKGAYEKLLFHYEQKLVFDVYPQNPTKAVNMKMIVSAQKEAERKAARDQAAFSGNGRRKQNGRGSSKRDATTQESKSEGKTAKRTKLNDVNIESMGKETLPEQTEDTYMSMVKEFTGHQFCMPEWSLNIPTEEGYEAMIQACHRLDMTRQVISGHEVILLAMAECFSVSGLTPVPDTGSLESQYNVRDMCLASEICTMPVSVRSTRKAQAFLFHLLVNATNKKKGSVLADNRSANGLVNGLMFQLVHYIKKDTTESIQSFLRSNNEEETKNSETQGPSNTTAEIEDTPKTQTEASNQEVAAAYCALRILANLSTESRNQAHIVAHGGLLSTYASLISYAKLHESFRVAILETLQNCASLLPLYTDVQESSELLDAFLGLLERTTSTEEESGNNGTLDFDTSSKVLSILSYYSRSVHFHSSSILRFIGIIAKLMFAQQTVTNLEDVATIAHNLAATWPELTRQNTVFVHGVLQLITNPRCAEFASGAIGILHRTQPLFEYAEEIGQMCAGSLTQHIKLLAGILADLFLSGAKINSISQNEVLEILKTNEQLADTIQPTLSSAENFSEVGGAIGS